jgi:hypothetical protein
MVPHAHRDAALDNLRAAAMLLGLVTHGVLPFKATGIGRYPLHDCHHHVAADACYFALHDFRMQLFFLLAGFAAAALAARRGVAGLVRNRLHRVAAPLLLSIIVLAPIMWALLVNRTEGVADLPSLDMVVWLGPNFHLWFLYYLALCSATLAVWLTLCAGLVPGRLTRAADGGFRWLVGSRWRAAVLAAVTVPVLWDMPDWWVETPQGWTPDATIFVYYLGFFAFGSMLYRHRDLVAGFGRRWLTLLVVANVAVLPLMLKLTISGNWAEEEGGAPSWPPHWKAATIFLGGLYTWLMVEGLVGLFRRFFPVSTGTWQYLGGASYWCYLAGFPVQVALQVVLADHPMPLVVKFLLATAVTLGVLLVSYELMVRDSWVGWLLNGSGRGRSAAPDRPAPVPALPRSAAYSPLAEGVLGLPGVRMPRPVGVEINTAPEGRPRPVRQTRSRENEPSRRSR